MEHQHDQFVARRDPEEGLDERELVGPDAADVARTTEEPDIVERDEQGAAVVKRVRRGAEGLLEARGGGPVVPGAEVEVVVAVDPVGRDPEPRHGIGERRIKLVAVVNNVAERHAEREIMVAHERLDDGPVEIADFLERRRLRIREEQHLEAVALGAGLQRKIRRAVAGGSAEKLRQLTRVHGRTPVARLDHEHQRALRRLESILAVGVGQHHARAVGHRDLRQARLTRVAGTVAVAVVEHDPVHAGGAQRRGETKQQGCCGREAENIHAASHSARGPRVEPRSRPGKFAAASASEPPD